MNPETHEKTEELKSINLDIDGLTLPQLIDKLRSWNAHYTQVKTYTRVTFDIVVDYGDEARIVLTGYRPETAEERSVREEAEKADANWRQGADRAQYERLKKQHPEWFRSE